MYSHKNFFFDNLGSEQEQDLLEDLIVESISIYGEDLYYIPRVINNYDPLYTADDSSSYNQAFPVVMYIESYDAFKGDGNFMSKMGLEIKDQIVFTIAQRVFKEEVEVVTGQIRPNEGDLIYFPQNEKVFQIKFVDKFAMFYQLGKLYTWKMETELFEYSNEQFSTGIPQIDSIQQQNDTNVLDYTFMDQNGNIIVDQDGNYITIDYNIESEVPAAENDEIQKESDVVIKQRPTNQFSESDPFGEQS